MSPILVTETQYLAILNAANALCASDRDQFVAAVYAELHGKPIGDGSIGRAIMVTQVAFPHPTPPERPSRWDRNQPRFESLAKRSAA
jgi:hypothetical protein